MLLPQLESSQHHLCHRCWIPSTHYILQSLHSHSLWTQKSSEKQV
jgi:hypothetical protein